MTTSSYYLGVDGGGSKTLAVIVDAQGHARGRGVAGSAYYAAIGLEQAVQNILRAIEQAKEESACGPSLSNAWLGLAGVDRLSDSTLLAPRMASLASIVRITNDADLAFGALPAQTGVVLIAGTGSIALGRNEHGIVTRAGGWGHILGDEGSGYDIGRQGLQAATRMVDGRGKSTLLLDLILQHWHIHKPQDMLDEVYLADDKAKIAQIALCVIHAAQQDDAVALALVAHAADELALLVQAVRLHVSQDSVPLALGGSLLLHNDFFRACVLQRIQHVEPILHVHQPALSAARAAISF